MNPNKEMKKLVMLKIYCKNWTRMIQILNYIVAIMIILSIFFVEKRKIWWLVYSAACLLCGMIMIAAGLYGLCIMNMIASIIGIKNYIKRKGQ